MSEHNIQNHEAADTGHAEGGHGGGGGGMVEAVLLPPHDSHHQVNSYHMYQPVVTGIMTVLLLLTLAVAARLKMKKNSRCLAGALGIFLFLVHGYSGSGHG